MRIPRAITHVLDSDSKSATFGWWLSLSATVLFMARPTTFDSGIWMNAQMIAGALLGGKLLKETMLGKKPEEVKPDAPPAPAA